MGILARNSITLFHVREVETVTCYYKLQASTAEPPAKPTTLIPSGWTTTEPGYEEGSTNSLYITQRTVFSDGVFEYSDVSLSSSYEAAKTAYNKAQAAASDAANALTSANSKNKVFHQSSAPPASVGLQVGDTWFDTSNGYKINTWDGSEWVAEPLDTDALAVGAVKAQTIDAGAVTAAKIAADAVTADKVAAGAITAENLAVGDFTNYATVNQHTGSMNSTSGRETVVFTDTNNNDVLVYRKKTESQQYLPVAVGLVTNPFRSGDEVYYDITLRTTSGNARDVQLMIACYDASKTFITGHGVTLSLTASYQRFTGSRSITNASFDTAAYVFFYINDNNDTKKQILVKSARIYRKTVGNLIVDGTISASQINGGTLTVGGSNNTNGQIVVIDANGDNVGTWNNNGLTGAKRLETAMGDRQELTFNSGIKNNADTVTSSASKVRIIPKGIQSIDSGGTYRSQLLPAKFNGTTYDGSIFGQNGVPQYGWYVTPMLYAQRIFSKTGEGFTWGDWGAERHNFRDDLLENYVPNTIQDALDDFEANVVDPQLDDFVYKYFDEIDNWNTRYYDDDGKEWPVRFLKSYQAANSPESGAAHFVGLELSFSSNHRIQLAMRTNTTTVAAPLYIRHNNGSWLGWAKITTTAV